MRAVLKAFPWGIRAIIREESSTILGIFSELLCLVIRAASHSDWALCQADSIKDGQGITLTHYQVNWQHDYRTIWSSVWQVPVRRALRHPA